MSFARLLALRTSWGAAYGTKLIARRPSVSICSPASLQPFSSSSTVLPAVPELEPSGNRVVDDMNQALRDFPMTTALWYLYSNMVFSGAAFAGLAVLGIPAPVELAAAWGLNRLTVRLRMPIILAAAAGLVKARPSFSKLHLSQLIMTPFKGLKEAANESKVASKIASAVEWGINPAGGLLDKYGLAYIVCGRVVASLSMLAFAFALHYGLDVDAMLAQATAYFRDTVVVQYIEPNVSLEVRDQLPKWALEAIGLQQPSPTAGGDGTAADGVPGGGIVATGAGLLSRWAMACLLVNAAYYPWLLRHGVARFAMHRLGPFLQKNVASKLKD